MSAQISLFGTIKKSFEDRLEQISDLYESLDKLAQDFKYVVENNDRFLKCVEMKKSNGRSSMENAYECFRLVSNSRYVCKFGNVHAYTKKS